MVFMKKLLPNLVAVAANAAEPRFLRLFAAARFVSI
jgi:hypothetical protein